MDCDSGVQRKKLFIGTIETLFEESLNKEKAMHFDDGNDCLINQSYEKFENEYEHSINVDQQLIIAKEIEYRKLKAMVRLRDKSLKTGEYWHNNKKCNIEEWPLLILRICFVMTLRIIIDFLWLSSCTRKDSTAVNMPLTCSRYTINIGQNGQIEACAYFNLAKLLKN